MRLLILDDNRAHAENLRDVLEVGEVELEPILASTAKEAFEIFRAVPVDVAIVDLKLPDGSGVELIAPFKALQPRCEIVLLTGNATIESAIGAHRAGATGFLLKSASPGELITTVKQAVGRAALRREREIFERRYLALVNAADVLIVGLDAAGHVVFFNPKLALFTGLKHPDDAVGRLFVESWVDAVDARRFEAALRDTRELESVPELEIGMHDAGSAIRRVRWHLSRVHDEELGMPYQVYGIGVDVTAKRALERRAASAEALNAMAPLALGLAHEIRNPLNAAVLELLLLGRAIDKLENPEVRKPMRRRVEVVDGEIRRLERLLTEFLELARPRGPQREQVDLSEVVSAVLELEQEAMTRNDVALTASLPRALVLGDVEKLKQVVLNLVVNALDAMPMRGKLGATIDVDGDDVVFSLSDSGKGVDPRILSDVFDPFFTTKPAGTGLGLAIVRKIVEQHGGRVSLRPNSGGTTVEVRLPRLRGPVPRSAPPER